MNLPGAISSARLPERLRSLLTLVNLHYAGAAALLLLNLYFAASLFAAWRATSDAGTEALAQQQIALKTAQLQALPLEGLDTKLVTATEQADLFYSRRLPVSYSQVLTELGILTTREGVKLTTVRYSPVPVLVGTPGALTELRMDASLTGDYRPLVLFINSLERDRMFFLISGIALTGQQSGTVGLRLRLTTYLRPGLADDTTALPPDISSPAALDNTSSTSTPASPSTAALTPVPVVQTIQRPSAEPQPTSAGIAPNSSSAPRTSGFTPPPGGPPEIRSANPPPAGIAQQQ